MKTPLNYRQLSILVMMILGSFYSFAQYDTAHFIPPLYSRNSDTGELGRTYLHLSTNREDSFEVQVFRSNGVLFSSVMISADNPAEILLGFQYGAVGIVDQSGLNTIIDSEGIIAQASFPFFANLRHKASAQAMSLTSKGTAGMGTHFRSGHLFSRVSTDIDAPLKSHMISVMATEDNTKVKFSDFKQGVIFFGTAVSGNTTQDFEVTLNKYESYLIAAHLDEPFATGNELLVNGVLIESNLPIVVNTGSWCGGSNVANAQPSRDIGMDQIVPVQLLGTEYIVTKRYSTVEEECERVIIIADVDNTEVFINGNPQAEAILNAGEFYIAPAALFDQNDVMFISSTQKVYVYQSTNASPDVSHAQALNFIPPSRCTGLNEVTIPKPESFGGVPAGVDIIAHKGSAVYVNDVLLTLAPVPVTGNTDFEVYKLYNCSGTMNVRSENNISVSMIACSGISGATEYYSGFTPIPEEPEILVYSLGANNTVTEGCVKGVCVIRKPQALFNEDRTYSLQISGEAVNGQDYEWIPETITIAAGEIQDTLWILPLADGTFEQAESIVIRLLDVNCEGDMKERTIYIEKDQYIDFHLIDENQCLPFLAEFIDESHVAAGSIYLWDFGDGNSSNIRNPHHQYQQNGLFPVSLTIYTTNGCNDTLSLIQPELVNTHPTPQANFSVYPDRTDICNSLVTFTDLSIGADKIQYYFDDGTQPVDEAQPAYLYTSDGTHRPMQIVESIYGCIDTAYQEVYIEPFSLYAPNTFTPDGNEMNNVFLPVVSLDVQEWTMQIYNRWGELVFQSVDVDLGWDGILPDGVMAPDGTYQWVLIYKSCEPTNPRQSRNGHVNLIR